MALTKFKEGEYQHVISQKEVWGFLVSTGNALDNPVFCYNEGWTEQPPADTPATIRGLAGVSAATKSRYQKRELWQFKYDHMTDPKWGDAVSASVILQKVEND